MSETELKVRLQNAINTHAKWEELDPVLKKGEFAISSDRGFLYKAGNGIAKWSELQYNAASTLYGLNATVGELNHMDGVTSNVQTQLNEKAPSNHNHDSAYLKLSGGTLTCRNNSTEWLLTLNNQVASNNTGWGSGIKFLNMTDSDSKWSGITSVALSGYANSNGIDFYTSATQRFRMTDTSFVPITNNSYTLGDSSHKWSSVYATSFAGSGASLTALNASNISSGTLNSGRLPTVPVSKGGTGLTTLTSGQVLVGNGTGNVTFRMIDTTTGGTSGSTSLITSGAVYAGLAKKSDVGHTHNYAASNAAGGNAYNANALYLNSSLRQTSANINMISDAYSDRVTYMLATSDMETGKPPTDGHILSFGWDVVSGCGAQLAIGNFVDNHLYIRGSNDKTENNTHASNWGSWKTVLDSTNYNSYTPTKTGGGASGTWNINISGTAAVASKLGTSTLGSVTTPFYLNEGTATACSGRTVPGIKGASDVSTLGYGTNNNYVADISLLTYWNGAYSGTNSNLRYCNKGAFGTIITKNAGDYLASTGGTVTGTLVLSKTTDLSGTENNSPALIIGGTASTTHIEVDNNEIQAKASGTTTNDLHINPDGGTVNIGTSGLKVNGASTVVGTINSSKTSDTYLAGNQGATIINSTASAGTYAMLAKMNSTNGYFTQGCYKDDYLLQYTAKSTVDAGTNSVTKSVTLLDESGNSSFPGTITAPIFSGVLSGNATTASKLANPRTISLSGAVTGSVNFDGSGNVTLATSVNHTHSYLPLTGGKVTGEVKYTSNNAFRLAYGNYGTIFRNDGEHTFILLTNSGQAENGSWNDLRPFYINNSNGHVTIGNGLKTSGILSIGDNLRLYSNNEGGNIRFYYPSTTKCYEFDSWSPDFMRLYYSESDGGWTDGISHEWRFYKNGIFSTTSLQVNSDSAISGNLYLNGLATIGSKSSQVHNINGTVVMNTGNIHMINNRALFGASTDGKDMYLIGCNNDNTTVVGWGSYNNGIGHTEIMGNTVRINSKGGYTVSYPNKFRRAIGAPQVTCSTSAPSSTSGYNPGDIWIVVN